jgi:sugar O-acyltransferase (sialic acid O-acetyltransferase NeuD family)
MQDLLIFPFNGNGLEALNCLGDSYNFIGFVDDTLEKQGKNKFGHNVFSRNALIEYPNAKVLAVPGSPTSFSIRKKIISELLISPERFAKVIHPNATVSEFAEVGNNTLIMSGVVLTSNCKIGNHVCVLPNSVIHHDSIIDDYTLIGSNVTVAGGTLINENCYIGSGTSIINGIHIGKNVLIGMGTNVIKSIPDNVKVVGNPSRIL